MKVNTPKPIFFFFLDDASMGNFIPDFFSIFSKFAFLNFLL